MKKQMYKIALLAGFIFTSLSACAATNSSKQHSSNADNPMPFTQWRVSVEGDELVATAYQYFEFTVNRPIKEVWPVFKDMNQWHLDLTYFDSLGNKAVLGDKENEGKELNFTIRPNGLFKKYLPDSWKGMDLSAFRKKITIRKVIPGKVIIADAMHDTNDGRRVIDSYYIFMAHEENGVTKINVSMFYPPNKASKKDEEALYQGLEDLRFIADGRWNDIYIPTLKRLLEG